MSITFHENNRIAHMKNEKLSYIIEVVEGKYLVHRYLGKPVRKFHDHESRHYFKRAYTVNSDLSIENTYWDDIPLELPVRGKGDFRTPSLSVLPENGVAYLDLRFKEWNVLPGKPELKGLPGTYGGSDEVETLQIICEDDIAQIRVLLYYSLYKEKGLIARHQEIENYGGEPAFIKDAKSLSLDLPHQNYDWISLYGTYAKEANKERVALHHGIQKIESARGSSSPQYQPFFALASPEANSFAGEVIGFQLVYSGNFIAQAEMDQFGKVRAQIGINPDTFSWKLEAGESFTTPEAILNYSSNGLNEMSQNFHWLYQHHLMPKRWDDVTRPVLLNSWEAMYYDVSLEKIDQQTELAREVGAELFVLDDGWFRRDNTSLSAIGDWECNEAKLPGGIERAAKLVHKKGLKFGLWFEPEAVSRNSQLYEKHPDWILSVPPYPPMEGRHEYLLDLSRKEVRDYIIHMFDGYLKDGEIDYIKWDMNRPLTDVNSHMLDYDRKGEAYHRYVLGLYEVLEKVTKKYPDVLFEGCSSGGARFDPGMLYYVGQNWCSDNTDGFDRVYIQSGFSMLYPPVSMGAHVSITPNHQTGRTTSLTTRYRVAKLLNLGYELDLEKCSESERQEICQQICDYKKMRHLIMKGVFYQHDVADDNYVMWSISDREKKECIAMIFQKHYTPLSAQVLFKLPYLDPDSDYCEQQSGRKYGGDELAHIGVTVPLIREDFHVFEYHFIKV